MIGVCLGARRAVKILTERRFPAAVRDGQPTAVIVTGVVTFRRR
jgi:hypothetical protein